MRPLVTLCVCLAALALAARPDASPPRDASHAGQSVKPFALDDGEGKRHAFADLAKGNKAVVAVVLGTECPLNNAYLPILAGLHKEYSPRGVAFVGINSNSHDTPARILAHARANKIPFPVLKDTANVVADQLGAKRTPEAFVLDPAGKILYHGRIDDQIGIGYRRKEATRRDLAVALDETLAGKAVSRAYVEPAGCIVARALVPKQTGKVTFAKDVSRLLQNRCQECHRAGEVAPMPLVSYQDALAWSGMIEEVVREKRMPPWSADPKHGDFLNDRNMSAAERAVLLEWIAGGCPKGDDKDLPPAKEFPKGWMIGKPDAVFTAREYKVPADGGPKGVPYQNFFVETNFDEDKWIQSVEAKPGAREVVHHILVYAHAKSKDKKQLNLLDPIGDELLVAYAPGDLPSKMPEGYAKKLPKGAVLKFQMHYTPDGVERKDRSSIGIVFAKAAPKYEVRSKAVANPFFLIPPGAKAHKVVAQARFSTETTLISLLPHMHVRGKSFEYVVTYPDNKREVLLSVPKYDFNWQSNYLLRKPLVLPAGTRIECTAHYDNSEDNPNNPDAKKAVRWGNQTWEEMMIGFVEHTVPVRK